MVGARPVVTYGAPLSLVPLPGAWSRFRTRSLRDLRRRTPQPALLRGGDGMPLRSSVGCRRPQVRSPFGPDAIGLVVASSRPLPRRAIRPRGAPRVHRPVPLARSAGEDAILVDGLGPTIPALVTDLRDDQSGTALEDGGLGGQEVQVTRIVCCQL